ncbi:hypothetical protein Vadar_004257 [Vaccinium darrowii]|uniref:Uncharacterized protein n=1 Tax=Vaccinium darrowii TaxID=229202 RepID=A0ACB7ZI98_9ERIC|nr:hypothetical protein Vadar_004257 [Vaccinium darrowii]
MSEAMRNMSTRRRKDRLTAEEVDERNKKLREDKESKKKSDRVADLKKRGCRCERQLDEKSLKNLKGAIYLDKVRTKGMEFWFREVKGYVHPWVKTFYTNMEVDEVNERITSTVSHRNITVSPDIIAQYLIYTRPERAKITYPRDNIEEEDVVQAAYTDVRVQEGVSSLQPAWRAMNRVLHANLNPRGSETAPGLSELELVYVFMKDDEVIDCAQWIFNQMAEFKKYPKANLSFPYPVMVTKLCEALGGLKITPYIWSTASPGPINAASEARSESHSKQATKKKNPPENLQLIVTDLAGPSAAAPPPRVPKEKGVTIMKLLKSILCRQVEIQEDQERINHKLDYRETQLSEAGESRYEPLVGPWGDRAIGKHRSPPPPSGEDDEAVPRPGEDDDEYFARVFGED